MPCPYRGGGDPSRLDRRQAWMAGNRVCETVRDTVGTRHAVASWSTVASWSAVSS